MAFGVPVSLGANTATASVALTGVTVPAGALIVVIVGNNSSSTAGTMTDSASNTYLAATTTNNGVVAGAIFYATNVAALSSQSITYTPPGAASCALSAFYVTGELTSGSPLDLVTTPVSGTTISLTSGTPAVAGELFVGATVLNGVGLTYTQASGFATPPVAASTFSSDLLAGGNLINAGTGAVTYAPTFGGSVITAVGLLVSFKPAATASSMGWYGQFEQRLSKQIVDTSAARSFLALPIVKPGIAWQRQIEQFTTRQRIDQPAEPFLAPLAATSISGMAWYRQFEQFTAKKTIQVKDSVWTAQVFVAAGISGISWMRQFEQFTKAPVAQPSDLGWKIQFTPPPAQIGGMAWWGPFDNRLTKPRIEPPPSPYFAAPGIPIGGIFVAGFDGPFYVVKASDVAAQIVVGSDRRQ